MGAWIEIHMLLVNLYNVCGRTPRWVRGLKYLLLHKVVRQTKSHPTMGAWIEIFTTSAVILLTSVAPHDGCVDWNLLVTGLPQKTASRTPRWVRGLKSFKLVNPSPWILSHPTMGAWIEIFVLLVLLNLLNSRTPRWVRGLKLLALFLRFLLR